MPIPIPAECTRTYAEQFPAVLSVLPANFAALTPQDQARELVKRKAQDAQAYGRVLQTLIRCGHDDR